MKQQCSIYKVKDLNIQWCCCKQVFSQSTHIITLTKSTTTCPISNPEHCDSIFMSICMTTSAPPVLQIYQHVHITQLQHYTEISGLCPLLILGFKELEYTTQNLPYLHTTASMEYIQKLNMKQQCSIYKAKDLNIQQQLIVVVSRCFHSPPT